MLRIELSFFVGSLNLVGSHVDPSSSLAERTVMVDKAYSPRLSSLETITFAMDDFNTTSPVDHRLNMELGQRDS